MIFLRKLKISTKLVVLLLLAVVAYGVFGLVFYKNLNTLFESLVGMERSSQNIQSSSYLNSLAQYIRYYDESLTQSARNYAFTGEVKWKDRYNEMVPKLDVIIKEAIEKGNATDKILFQSVDKSNLALVKMEEEALGLVDKGKKSEAIQILQSADYWTEKAIYQKGLEQYAESKGKNYDDILSVSTSLFADEIKGAREVLSSSRWLIIFIFIFFIILVIGIFFAIRYLIVRPLEQVSRVAGEVAKGNFNEKIEIESEDEIGEVASAINVMNEKLRDSHLRLEEKVKERTAELEKMNKYMVDRELKMMELKKVLDSRTKQNEN